MHCITIKMSFQPTLGREEDIHKFIKLVHFSSMVQKFSVLGSATNLLGLMFMRTLTAALPGPDWSFQIESFVKILIPICAAVWN